MNKWFLLILLLPLFFLPQIASTRLGKPFFTKALEAKTESTIEIGSLSLSWFGPQKFQNVQWKRDEASGSVAELSIQAPFWSFAGPFAVRGGEIHYKGEKIEKIEGRVIDHDFDLTGETNQGHVSLKGKVFSKDQFSLDLDVTKLFIPILGTAIDLKGHLAPGGLTLKDPFSTSFRITPELSAHLPFLKGVESQTPATFRVETKDFFLPLPFSLEKLQMGQATLDLKQVRCRNGKSLAQLISLLKESRLADAKMMNGWFTPLVFRMKNGRVDLNRMDLLLADSIHLCTWGSINLIKDQIDMFLGIPADTLRKSFGIKNLSENYVLKVPIRGKIQDPEIVKGPAASQIAALLATGQISKKSPLGKVAELFSQPKEDRDVPPPQRPFPWEQ